MSKIKKYFMKKKNEATFKLKLGGGSLGEGHVLNSTKPEPQQRKSSQDAYVPPKRKDLSAEARAAAAAALSRIDKKDTREFNTSLAAVKAQAKRELEAERKLKQAVESSTSELQVSTSVTENKNLACQGVFFRCPLISDEVLSKNEWKIKIKEFLYQQLEYEPALTACLIIYNCNIKEKTEECVQTLAKYLENLINHPEEEKYCKIRMSNRIFCEKVRYVEGALEFLLAAGFREVELDKEPFLLWSSEQIEKDQTLPLLLDALKNAEIIHLELDRNIKVLLPSQARKVELPPDFYRLSPEELKREQQLRSEAIEQSQILRTKAMREREEQRNMRLYRYSLVRIKFPNGLYIQGTFNVYEKISDIFEFVQSCLIDEALEFNLVTTNGIRFSEEDLDKNLIDCRLVPTIVLLFATHENVGGSHTDVNFLKEDLLMLVESL